MEKIDIENLRYVQYGGPLEGALQFEPAEACRILAEKLNEIVDFLNKDLDDILSKYEYIGDQD